MTIEVFKIGHYCFLLDKTTKYTLRQSQYNYLKCNKSRVFFLFEHLISTIKTDPFVQIQPFFSLLD